VEGLLTSSDVHPLKRSNSVAGKNAAHVGRRDDIVNALTEALRPGASSAASERIAQANSVRYGTDPAFPGLMNRVDADGMKTPGRFFGRNFVSLSELDKAKSAASRA
jgi:hypothetical protein